MLQMILQTADEVPAVEVRFALDRLPDGRTWTYKPTAWRLPDGIWMKIVCEQPLQIGDIATAEQRTGFKIDWFGYKLSTLDYVYRFNRTN